MLKQNHLPMILRQLLQRIGKQNGEFAAGGPLAGSTFRSRQNPSHGARGTVQVLFQLSFQMHIAPLGTEIMAHQIRELRSMDRTEPLQ